jgi:hypothetical protein
MVKTLEDTLELEGKPWELKQNKKNIRSSDIIRIFGGCTVTKRGVEFNNGGYFLSINRQSIPYRNQGIDWLQNISQKICLPSYDIYCSLIYALNYHFQSQIFVGNECRRLRKTLEKLNAKGS